MQNDKLSLFDLLSFFVPGATLLYLGYFVLKQFVPVVDYLPSTESNFILVPYFFVSYFLGHIISYLGRILEQMWLETKKPWMNYLLKNPFKAQELNELNKELFKGNFFSEDAERKKIDADEADVFYHKAFYYLEINQRLAKVNILQAQYAFFRNASAIGLITFLLGIGVLIYKITLDNTPPFVFGLLTLAILFFLCSTYLMRERKQMMMATMYQIFLVSNAKPLKKIEDEK
jgi:hypothetical protein